MFDFDQALGNILQKRYQAIKFYTYEVVGTT